MDYSVVIPVHNEEECLPVLFKELKRSMASLGTYELIFVNDGSLDRSAVLLGVFHEEDPQQIKVVTIPARKGQSYAMRQGFDAAKGDIVITMDADLQNDPADIPRLIEELKDGYDCVCGWRQARQDTPLKAALSKFGNVLQRLFTGSKVHDVSCTLRVYQNKCIKDLPLHWEGQHRFIPLILSMHGYKIGELVTNHRKRLFGTTKYSHKRIFKVVLDFFRILIYKGRK